MTAPPATPAPAPRRCACPSRDPDECVRLRYGLRDDDDESGEVHSDPCECPCHDDERR